MKETLEESLKYLKDNVTEKEIKAVLDVYISVSGPSWEHNRYIHIKNQILPPGKLHGILLRILNIIEIGVTNVTDRKRSPQDK